MLSLKCTTVKTDKSIKRTNRFVELTAILKNSFPKCIHTAFRSILKLHDADTHGK